MSRALHQLLLFSMLALGASWALAAPAAEAREPWEGQPYRITVLFAIDAPGELADQLAEQLPTYLKERVNTSIGILWKIHVELVTGPLRHQLLEGVQCLTNEAVDAAKSDEDKRLFLVVRTTPWGYELAAREFDRYVERWGPTIRRSTRQRDALPEQLFALIEQAVAPLALLRPDPQEPQNVILDFRGADLPQTSPDFSWAQPGDVFQPLLRRTTRDGLLIPSSVAVVPWTYVEVVDPPSIQTDSSTPGMAEIRETAKPIGRLRSATLRPLIVRRGRVEQVAIGLRADPGDSTLRLESRLEREKPLVGYEVLAQNMDEEPLRPLGASDAAGQITVTPGKSAVQMLFVKSDNVLLARFPIVPGSVEQIATSLPDDKVRLRVSARLAAFREDMIDLVARRNIFMARVRQEIAAHNFEQARKLLESLDELPGYSQFNLTLDRESQQWRTKDLQVQRRIDQLFSQTRTALGKFLDPQPISELHEELRKAQSIPQESPRQQQPSDAS